MIDSYRSIRAKARIETEEKRSRFIAEASPLADEQEARTWLDGLRSEFPDASHHVYAWILGGEQRTARYSDDGEPQGTAGLPALDSLRRQNIERAGVVVVRYFGGTLLGTGGLVRAYGDAAQQAVEAAEPIDYCYCALFVLTVPYADFQVVRDRLDRLGFLVEDCQFGLDAQLHVAVPHARSSEFAALCADWTAGAALLEDHGFGYRVLPPPDPPPGS